MKAYHLDTKVLDLNNKGNSHGVTVMASYTNRPSQRATRKKLEELKNCKQTEINDVIRFNQRSK